MTHQQFSAWDACYHFLVPISDTTPEAEAVWLKIQRSKTGEQRLLEALEMSLFVKEVTKSGIRHHHPDWDEKQVERELLRQTFLPNPLPHRLR
jgi:hypothetical protein